MHQAKTRKYQTLNPPILIQIPNVKLFQALYFAGVFNRLRRFGNISLGALRQQHTPLRSRHNPVAWLVIMLAKRKALKQAQCIVFDSTKPMEPLEPIWGCGVLLRREPYDEKMYRLDNSPRMYDDERGLQRAGPSLWAVV